MVGLKADWKIYKVEIEIWSFSSLDGQGVCRARSQAKGRICEGLILLQILLPASRRMTHLHTRQKNHGSCSFPRCPLGQ